MTTPDPTQPPPPHGALGRGPGTTAATAPAGDCAATAAGRAGTTVANAGARSAARNTRTAATVPRRPGVLGISLVVGGAIVLLGRATDLTLGPTAWPLWLIVPGVAMVVGSFAIPPRGGLGLAIPGAVLAMIGVVLWFQATSGTTRWAYAWASWRRPASASGCCSTASRTATASWPAMACGRRSWASGCSSFSRSSSRASLAVRRRVHERPPGGAVRVGRVRRDPADRGVPARPRSPSPSPRSPAVPGAVQPRRCLTGNETGRNGGSTSPRRVSVPAGIKS